MQHSTDFLVIGSGIAGLSIALHAARYGSVTIITKKEDSESNTNYAQGGIACVLDPNDSPREHLEDTLNTGKGLCNCKAVEILVQEGPDRVKELLAMGVTFTTAPKSHAFAHLDLGREGGHSRNRIVHARDLTGRAVEKALLQNVKRNPNISLLQHHCAVELITNHHLKRSSPKSRCHGAYVFDAVHRVVFPLRARIVCLASGGGGRVYAHTTNPAIATGDGLACAYRAGADIANMEFIQFHPTTLYHPNADSFLISEALRGFGAVLRDSKGNEFMRKYHEMGSLAPRDVVARAIDTVIKQSGEPCVYLDVRHKPAEAAREAFPHIYAKCREYGIDFTRDLVPVVPAAHYICGGIRVNTHGNTNIDCLYACGEVASTGVHGANRLASNSLLEALVYAKRAAEHAAGRLSTAELIPADEIAPWDDSGTIDNEEWVLISHNFAEIGSVMWDYVGIVRSTLRLNRALRRIRLLDKEIEDFYRRTKITVKILELRNMVTTAKLIVLSALKRHESRGLHFTTDFPEQNDRYWKRDTVLSRSRKPGDRRP
ncbi:MAG: L-aspartate oxidase [Chitinivibrionales bacterium]|nr:L-aspartate oxidase [Chitinivibrionales bacterium]MBD3356078.1 L-aspartate oxidase [Chitinivibrionales bacterium]